MVIQDGKVVYGNKPAENLLTGGLDELSYIQLIHPSERDKCKDIHKNLLLGKSDVPSMYETVLLVNGEEMDVEIKGGIGEWNEKTSTILHIRDITKRKEQERKRQGIERIIQHDLKEPLNGMVNTYTLLEMDDNLRPDQLELLQEVRKVGYELVEIINYGLELSKIENGNYQIEPETFNLEDTIYSISSLLLNTYKNRHFSFDQNRRVSDEFKKFQGVPSLMYSLMFDLFKNAFETSKEHEIIKCKIGTNKTYNYILIHNDKSIPEELHYTLFDKYTTSGKQYGTGLDMYSAKMIAEAHNGKINFRSSEKHGTTMVVQMSKITS